MKPEEKVEFEKQCKILRNQAKEFHRKYEYAKKAGHKDDEESYYQSWQSTLRTLKGCHIK